MLSDKNLQNKINALTNKLKIGLFDEVIVDTKLLLKKRKNQVLFNILSLAYQSKGEFDNSIELLEDALKISPKNIFFLNNMGLSYYKKSELSKAEYYYKRALEVNPNYINVLSNYANLKKELEQFEEAKEYFKKANTINDKSFEINYNLATVYQGLGEEDNAIKSYEKSLSINPKFTKSDRSISSLIKYTDDNEHFLKMKNKILDKDLSEAQKLELHFALGKAYEDLKDYKNAFENFEKANSIVKRLTKYKINDDQELFYKIKKNFTNKEIALAKHNKSKIIFILGMPRSGTSLVEQIISSHHQVFGAGELVYLNEIMKKKLLPKPENFDFIINEAQKEYLSKISYKSQNALNITDKSPLNFRWIGFIISMFPNSKIIHCKRNKIDVCWSNYKNQFEGSLYYSNNLNDLGEYYKLYEDLMKFWKKKFEKKIFDLDYEELVNEPEKNIKDLIKFCDLEWDENCMNHHKNKRAIKTVSFNQARKPIYKDKIKNSSLYDKYLNELKQSLK